MELLHRSELLLTKSMVGKVGLVETRILDNNYTNQETRGQNPGELMARKPYRKPELRQLGDLRTLTLGGSPGTGDSGGGVGVQFPIGRTGTGLPIYNPDGSLQSPDDPVIEP